jgi:multiple sugar transport system ATP-binding protein
MRAEIKRLHIAQHATTVYVTHDQIEAMAMGDRIVVMSNAEVQQIGTPADVYYNPANLFVARFIGSPGMNLISGEYADGIVTLPGNSRYPVPAAWRPVLEHSLSSNQVILGFRPEAAVVGATGVLHSEVYADDLHGAYSMLHLALDGKQAESMVHVRSRRDAHYPIGTPFHFDLDPAMVRFFDPQTGITLPRPPQQGALVSHANSGTEVIHG